MKAIQLISNLAATGILLVDSGNAAPQSLEPTRDQRDLIPVTSVTGPILKLDFPELHIGIAEYNDGPTGATVFYFPEPVMAAIDVRGGAPGVINSEALRLPYEVAYTNAVAFSGGSSYGLAVAPGVADAIKERIDRPGHWENIVFVPGAIIFDLGGRRLNAVTPDYELGKAALRASKPGAFPLGAQGAGRFAMQGWYLGDPQHSGQGGALRVADRTKVAVFTVVNSLGGIVDREGQLVRCSHPAPDGCGAMARRLEERLAERLPNEAVAERSGQTTNTTITLVVTNEKLSIVELQRLAIQVHSSMARAIQPFSTLDDGDTLIAVTTGQIETEGLSVADLGVLASETAWDAVLASVPELPDLDQVKPVEWSNEQMDAVAGEYRFSRWSSLTISREKDHLVAHGPEASNLYFPTGKPVDLIPISPIELVIDSERRHRIRFNWTQDRVTGLTLEPGPWAQQAHRAF
jgi:L-aminopeptidase/D-esterase-like protein